MAINNRKSTIVSNRDNVPPIENKLWYEGARVYSSVANIAKVALDTDGSVFRFFRVRSSDRINKLEFANDAMAGFTSADFGVLETAENGGGVAGGTAANQYLFAQASNIYLAAARTEITYLKTATMATAKNDQQLWQWLGLAVDSGREYDIAITGTTCGTAAGGICMWMDRIKGQ